MRQSKVAKRYAKALFDLALETNKLEEVKNDLMVIRAAHHAQLSMLLASPVVSGDKKNQLFDAVFSKHIQPLTQSFFRLIFHKGRAVVINNIVDAFLDMYRLNKGIKVVEVTTAVAVTDEVRSAIIKKLEENSMLKGKSIELKEKVDPSILGGLVVQVDDKLFDASIRHDLQHIKRQFIKNMYVSEIG